MNSRPPATCRRKGNTLTCQRTACHTKSGTGSWAKKSPASTDGGCNGGSPRRVPPPPSQGGPIISRSQLSVRRLDDEHVDRLARGCRCRPTSSCRHCCGARNYCCGSCRMLLVSDGFLALPRGATSLARGCAVTSHMGQDRPAYDPLPITRGFDAGRARMGGGVCNGSKLRHSTSVAARTKAGDAHGGRGADEDQDLAARGARARRPVALAWWDLSTRLSAVVCTGRRPRAR